MAARLFVAGDVVNCRHKDGMFCSSQVQAKIKGADFAIANLEAPISGYGSAVRKCGPVISQEPATITGMRAMGFNAVALANNHIMDFGADGLQATQHALDQAGIQHLGAGASREQAYRPLIVTVNDLRIGLVNACEAHHGVHDHLMPEAAAGYAWLFAPEVARHVEACAAECDATIVLAHAGMEHFDVPLLEWRALYRHLCDLGATVVAGSHPHVPQGMERHGDSLIFYSLGNFYFDTIRYAASPDPTYSVVLTLDKGGLVDWEPYYTHKQDGVVKPVEPSLTVPSVPQLAALLADDYERRVEAMVLSTHATLAPLLQRAISPWGLPTNLRATLRYWGSRILRGSPAMDRTRMLQHLLRNESYYFALRHAAAIRVDGPPGYFGFRYST